MSTSHETANGGAAHTGDSNLSLKPYSERLQRVSPSGATRTVTLPPATRMVRMKGAPRFYILNTGSTTLEIDDNDGATLATLSADEGAMVGLLDNSTNAGRWLIHTRSLNTAHSLSSSTRSEAISETQVERGALEQDTCELALYRLVNCSGSDAIYTRDELGDYSGGAVLLDSGGCYLVERFDDLAASSIQSVTIDEGLDSCDECPVPDDCPCTEDWTSNCESAIWPCNGLDCEYLVQLDQPIAGRELEGPGSDAGETVKGCNLLEGFSCSGDVGDPIDFPMLIDTHVAFGNDCQWRVGSTDHHCMNGDYLSQATSRQFSMSLSESAGYWLMHSILAITGLTDCQQARVEWIKTQGVTPAGTYHAHTETELRHYLSGTTVTVSEIV